MSMVPARITQMAAVDVFGHALQVSGNQSPRSDCGAGRLAGARCQVTPLVLRVIEVDS